MTDQRSLTGRVALVTGGTDGIGRATAVRLAERGATVLITGRDERKGERVRAAVEDAHDAAEGEVFLAEFSSRQAVCELARTVRDQYDRLDVLVNNAGTYQEKRQLVDEWCNGPVEYTVAVNHLAPFLLTNCLVALLRDSAPARVVTVSSRLHRNGTFDPATVVTQPDFDGLRAYADSKLATLLFTYELADRLDGSGVTANAVHPGIVPGTSLWRSRSGISGVLKRLKTRVGGWLPSTDDVVDGAAAVEYVATSPELAGVTGTYFRSRERRRSSPASRDEQLQAKCWALSADLAGLPEAVPAVDPLAAE